MELLNLYIHRITSTAFRFIGRIANYLFDPLCQRQYFEAVRIQAAFLRAGSETPPSIGLPIRAFSFSRARSLPILSGNWMIPKFGTLRNRFLSLGKASGYARNR